MTDCIFICSAGHSGSTLLDLLIGSHSRVASLGEISHLPKNIALNTTCTCGDSVRACNVWQQVIKDLDDQLGTDILARPYSLNLGPFKAMVIVDRSKQTRFSLFWQYLIKVAWYIDLRFGRNILPMLTAQAKQGIDNNFLVYESVGKILNADKVVDSSKSYFKAAELYRRHPDRVKIILLVRDGRAVFYSGIKNGFRRRRCVNAWKYLYARALPIFDKTVRSTDVLRVRYEDLAQNPETELKRVCEFVGIEFEPGMLAFMEQEHHLTNGNDMRFRADSSIRFDDSWRQGLSPTDLEYFEGRAAGLNKSLGYQ